MTAVAEETPVITQAGIYDGLDEVIYHSDPVLGGSLSVSGAKKLLPPSVPAKFDYERKHPSPPTKAMELGTAAHKLVLGTGPRIVHIDADDWRKKATQEQGKEVRAEGGVPLLTKDYLVVQEMAAAIRAHPVAGALFDPDRGGQPERSLFWQDDRFGVWRRSRLDWMSPLDRGRPVIGDFKTCESADKAAVARSTANYRYFMQSPWYVDAVAALTGVTCGFVFVFQEKTPPYLVAVRQLGEDAEMAGRMLNDRALEIFRDCDESGIWPGYGEEIEDIALPGWAAPREDW